MKQKYKVQEKGAKQVSTKYGDKHIYKFLSDKDEAIFIGWENWSTKKYYENLSEGDEIEIEVEEKEGYKGETEVWMVWPKAAPRNGQVQQNQVQTTGMMDLLKGIDAKLDTLLSLQSGESLKEEDEKVDDKETEKEVNVDDIPF